MCEEGNRFGCVCVCWVGMVMKEYSMGMVFGGCVKEK